MNTVTEFVKDLPWMKQHGYDPFMIYVQCYLETGNFMHLPQNNFAGMMNGGRGPDGKWYDDPKWKGRSSVFLPSGEQVIDDGTYTIKPFKSKFKLYDRPLEFFIDYDAYVQPKFPYSYLNRAIYQKYYRGLQNIVVLPSGLKEARWPSFSTSITYAEVLTALYPHLNQETHYELLAMINA